MMYCEAMCPEVELCCFSLGSRLWFTLGALHGDWVAGLMASSVMWESSLYVADVGHPGVIGVWGSEPHDSVDMG